MALELLWRQSLSCKSRSCYRKETTSSVRTSCESRPIRRPLAHPSNSHQSSSSGLATLGRSTKADMAACNRARPSGPITLVSTLHGCVRMIVQSGVSLWRPNYANRGYQSLYNLIQRHCSSTQTSTLRQLCSLMGALLDDEDE